MDRLNLAYEEMIRMVEQREVTPETDRLLQWLGEEMNSRTRSGKALVNAARFLTPTDHPDSTPTGRISFLCRSIPEQEWNKHLPALADILLEGQAGRQGNYRHN